MNLDNNDQPGANDDAPQGLMGIANELNMRTIERLGLTEQQQKIVAAMQQSAHNMMIRLTALVEGQEGAIKAQSAITAEIMDRAGIDSYEITIDALEVLIASGRRAVPQGIHEGADKVIIKIEEADDAGSAQ